MDHYTDRRELPLLDFILIHAVVKKEAETIRESDKKFMLAVSIN